ncbi:MAG: PorT family protein [Maribacter sp.]|nr:PorT family protein [Maribacter sp.]
MKKILLLSVITLFSLQLSQAQSLPKFGITGGLLNTNVDFKTGNSLLNLVGVNNFAKINSTGFYIGGLVDIGVIGDFHIQPELLYGSAEDLSFFYLPVMAKYYVADKFHLQAGPQLTFSSNIDDIKRAIRDTEELLGTNGNVDDVLDTFGIDISLGAGFDITDNLTLQARYSFGLTDIYSGPVGGVLDIKNDTFQVGIAYMF